MTTLTPPGHLEVQGNICENWRKFKQQWSVFFVASEYSRKRPIVQCSLFLHTIGQDALEIYNTFTFEEENDRNVLEMIIEKFENYCRPLKNLTFDRHKFFSRDQKDQESFEDYVRNLKILANACEFGDLKDSLIRDRIVCGIEDTNLKEKLLRIRDLTLANTEEICKASEMTKTQMKSFHSGTSGPSDVLRIERRQRENRNSCKMCGYTHRYKNCPAFGKQCMKCRRFNHFSKMCRNKATKIAQVMNEVNEDVEEDESLFIQ